MAKVCQDMCVKLDIGGTHFKTTLTTLMNGEKMLSAMFSGRTQLYTDENGRVFLDRNPNTNEN